MIKYHYKGPPSEFYHLFFSEYYTGRLGRYAVKVRLILLAAMIASMSFSQSAPNDLDSNEVYEAPADDVSWLYHNSSSADIFEVHDGEIILNGDKYSKINSTGYHLIESVPSGSGSSGGCNVATFHLNGSWFKLQGRNMHIHNGTGWEFTSSNEQQYVNSINCYRRFIRIDYENMEFTIASHAASRGPTYQPQHCYYATFFSTFDENGSHISTREYYHHNGPMQQTSNGQCKAQADGTTQGGSHPIVSNRNLILSSNESFVYGYETYDGTSETMNYVLTYANNNSEAFTMVNYQNNGYNEGVNYFQNESGEHIIFRDKNEILSDVVIVTLHSNGTVTNRTIIDPFPQDQDCIQAEISGLFGIPSYIECENGDVVDIENQSIHNYGSSTPTIIGDVEDMPEIGLRSGSIITVDSDDDGVEHFSDECPYTAANEEVDQYGCSDDQYVDRWIKIELKSWEADQSVYWDSNEGLPDPHFHVIVVVDGDEFGTYTSPTWENTWTLVNAWNLSIDIPNGARIIDIEIQCEDNDALNDDECEMNGEDGEWKLYYQFDVSGPSVVDFSGDGTTDNDTSWREASSNWTISYLTYDEIDSDNDGVINRFDECPGYDDNIDADSDEIPDGCDDYIDSDNDGVIDSEDICQGYDDSDDFDGDGDPAGCDTDDDNDGTLDPDDLCPNTPIGAIVDWGCPMDDDDDGVYDGLDDCPNSVGEVDANGCDLDSDGDGIPDYWDNCPNTPIGEEMNLDEYEGCSLSQIDSDGDGVKDNLDQCPNSIGYEGVDVNGCDLDSDSDGTPDFDDSCPNTPQGAAVDYMGCPSDLDGDSVFDGIDECPNTPQGARVNFLTGCHDSDEDGVYDNLDACENTPFGATTDSKGCPIDSDSDGVYDGIDECPSSNNPSPSDMDKSSEVDSTGCFIDTTESGSDSVSSGLGLFGALIIIVGAVFVIRKIRTTKVDSGSNVQNQSPVIPNLPQFVPTPQVSSRERQLEHQSRQAQTEAQRLRQLLANQAQITQQLQSEAAQKQMSEAALAQKKNELAVAQKEKEELEAKLAEAEKNTPIVQNITFNIQDSAISGDITNKIN